jgi:HAD superfamily hydrolase (TIGR01509 family)
MKVIVFDITGVIFPHQPWVGDRPPKEKFAEIKRIGAVGYKKGSVTAETLRENIYRAGLPKVELDAIYNSLTAIDEKVVALIERLQEKYDLYSIANEAEHWTDIRDELTGFKKYFKKLYISVEVGVRKPDNEIYELLLNETGLDPRECLFIDDKKKNVDAAIGLGFVGHMYEGPESLEAYLVGNGYM